MTNNSRLLPDELSSGEDRKVWNPTYRVACGELLIPVGIDLKNDGLTGHVRRRARDLRGGGAARTAPVSPEINQDRNTRVLDDVIE